MIRKFALLAMLGVLAAGSQAAMGLASASLKASFTYGASFKASSVDSNAFVSGTAFAFGSGGISFVSPYQAAASGSSNSGVNGIGSSTGSGTVTVNLINLTNTTQMGLATFEYALSASADSTAAGSIISKGSAGFSILGAGFTGVASVGGTSGPGNQLSESVADTLSVEYALLPFEVRTVTIAAYADTYAAAVPEPATLGALALGAVAMMRRRKK